MLRKDLKCHIAVAGIAEMKTQVANAGTTINTSHMKTISKPNLDSVVNCLQKLLKEPTLSRGEQNEIDNSLHILLSAENIKFPTKEQVKEKIKELGWGEWNDTTEQNDMLRLFGWMLEWIKENNKS